MMNQDRPILSVVTASYNHGRFIGDAIRSVMAQGWFGVEHIIVDAMSTDETPEILAEFPHLRVIREPDKGQSDGLNKGFQAARGDFCVWLNSDDYLLPGAFDAFWQHHQKHPNAGAFFSHFYHVDGAGELIRALRVPPFNPNVNRHYGVCWPTSGSFYSRRIFNELNIALDLDFHITMDWDFYQQLHEANVELVRIPEFLSAFRVHEENKSIGINDPDLERRAKLDRRRFEERLMFAKRYGWRLGLGEGVDDLARRALLHAGHARFVASKAVRGYYLADKFDRWREHRDIQPPTL